MTTTFAPRPAVGAAPPYRFPTPVTRTLDNGLRVEHYPTRSRLITAKLLTCAGALHEPDGAEGVCALVTDLRAEGTIRRNGEEFAAALDLLGARYHTAVHDGFSAVRIDVPASGADGALSLLAETATGPTFPTDEVDRVRGMLVDSSRSIQATPGPRAERALRTACFAAGSRMALPVTGLPDTLARLTRGTVAAFAERHLTPGASTLLIGGDLDPDLLDRLAGTHFGTWHAAPGIDSRPVAIPFAGSGIVVVHRPGAVQTELRLGAPCAGRADAGFPALRLSVQALGGSMNSRLSAVLREEKGYTYGVFARVQPLPGRGLLTIATSVDTPSTEAALADLLGIVQAVCTEGITDAERDRAVDELLLSAPLDFQTGGALVEQRAGQILEGLPVDWLDAHRDAVRAASTTEASTAIAAALNIHEPHLALVGDADRILPALNRLFPATPVTIEEL